MITKKYYKLIRVSHADSEYFRITNISNEIGEFSFVKTGSPNNPNTEYSLDGVNYTAYDFTNCPAINVTSGSSIYFRGTTWTQTMYPSPCITFHFTKNYKISGNLLSLYNYNTMNTETTLSKFAVKMFSGETNLIYADEMNLGPNNLTTSGQQNWFYQTFKDCTNLVKGPDFSRLTSITGNCFGDTFQYCSNLQEVTAPNVSTWTSSQFSNWLQFAGTSVPSGTTKVFNAPINVEIPTGNNGIPTGWTRVDY